MTAPLRSHSVRGITSISRPSRCVQLPRNSRAYLPRWIRQLWKVRPAPPILPLFMLKNRMHTLEVPAGCSPFVVVTMHSCFMSQQAPMQMRHGSGMNTDHERHVHLWPRPGCTATATALGTTPSQTCKKRHRYSGAQAPRCRTTGHTTAHPALAL
jgi:hypothetical protein